MAYKMVKLKEIADLKNGYAFKSKDYIEKSNNLLCRMSNIRVGGLFDLDYNPKYLPDDFLSKHNAFLLEDGDLVIAMTDLANDPKILGVPTIVETKGRNVFLNQRVGKLEIQDKNVHIPYLRRALSDPKVRKYYSKFAGGGLQINIGKKDILDVEVPLPPMDIQIKIASALDKAQELIDNRKVQIAKYDELLQSVFLDMFGDPVTNSKGWEVEKLGNKCKIYRGGSPRPISKFLGGTIPWIKIGDATKGDNIYLHKTKEHILEEGIKKSRFVEKGELIFANCGVSLGFARILKFDGCIHDGWLVFKNITSDIEKIFLLKLLNHYTNYFRETAPDGTQPNLNTSIMKEFKIILPPLPLQNKFAEIVEKVENEKKILEESLKQLEDNFNSIMQRAFKGDLF